MEQVIKIRNAEGRNLYGILHLPEEGERRCKKVAVHLLNPGLKGRVAPNRLNIKIARRLAERGFIVLRLDPAGIGDSEGELPEIPVTDLWGEIQVGRFVQDVQAANDYLKKTQEPDYLVLMGSCGGAITAILVGAKNSEVDHYVLIDVPVTLSSNKTMNQDYLGIIEADNRYRSVLSLYYLKSLINPKSLKRFFTLKSDYRAIVKVVSMKWNELSRRGRDKEQAEGVEAELPNMNPRFLQAVENVFSRRARILFLCAEKDTDTQLFEKGFQNKYLKPGNLHEGLYKVVKIKDANHIYTSVDSQQALLSSIEMWMDEIA